MKPFTSFVGRALMVLAIVLGLALFTGSASAQTDITATISALSGYWTAVLAVSIPILLYVVGRRIVRKL